MASSRTWVWTWRNTSLPGRAQSGQHATWAPTPGSRPRPPRRSPRRWRVGRPATPRSEPIMTAPVSRTRVGAVGDAAAPPDEAAGWSDGRRPGPERRPRPAAGAVRSGPSTEATIRWTCSLVADAVADQRLLDLVGRVLGHLAARTRPRPPGPPRPPVRWPWPCGRSPGRTPAPPRRRRVRTRPPAPGARRTGSVVARAGAWWVASRSPRRPPRPASRPVG